MSHVQHCPFARKWECHLYSWAGTLPHTAARRASVNLKPLKKLTKYIIDHNDWHTHRHWRQKINHPLIKLGVQPVWEGWVSALLSVSLRPMKLIVSVPSAEGAKLYSRTWWCMNQKGLLKVVVKALELLYLLLRKYFYRCCFDIVNILLKYNQFNSLQIEMLIVHFTRAQLNSCTVIHTQTVSPRSGGWGGHTENGSWCALPLCT